MYNAEDYIGECIESVLAQSIDDWELLVVDDGSTDESARIVNEFVVSDKRIRLLAHPDGANLGVSSSRQLGVHTARGKYIAFLDADDFYEENKLETQIAAMVGFPDCVVCHTGVTEISDRDKCRDETLFNQSFTQPHQYNLHERDDFLDQNLICNSTVLVRAHALSEVIFAFPQLFQYEDWTLWILLSTGGSFLYLPDRLVHYRIHDKSATSAVLNNSLRERYSRVEFLSSVLALCDDSEIIDAAEVRLHETLDTLRDNYRKYVPPPKRGVADSNSKG